MIMAATLPCAPAAHLQNQAYLELEPTHMHLSSHWKHLCTAEIEHNPFLGQVNHGADKTAIILDKLTKVIAEAEE